MTPEATALLILLAGATSIRDAHGHAVDAVKAGASSEEVSQAITAWMSLQAAQVQRIFADRQRRDCCTGVERDHGGRITCPCGLPVPHPADGTPCWRQHREHPQTADIQDYLRQKGEIS